MAVKFLNRIKKKKIGFWAGDENNFQFVDPLIHYLSKKYKTEKFNYSGDSEQLKEQMASVDLCWFEWGNGPVVPASQQQKTKPIINRIHRYEVYSDSPRHVVWENVDKLIFSSPSMVKKYKKKFKKESTVAPPILLPIGIDENLFTFKQKKTSNTSLYVGRIHPHKNPSLFIQIAAKTVKQSPSHKFIVIGVFHDELYEEYFRDQLEKQGLSKNVEIIAKLPQDELVKYYQQADTFIISSIIEGLSQASLEAMACGAVPVIFDYYGSERAYPNKFIYKTVDEAVDMILSPVGKRQESREFIEKKYLLSESTKKTIEIIEGLL